MLRKDLIYPQLLVAALFCRICCSLAKKPYLKYHAWEEKLRSKVVMWYKTLSDFGFHAGWVSYQSCENIPSKQCHNAAANNPAMFFQAADKLGIEEKFFQVLGLKNPLIKKKFHELTFYQRVILVKSLCQWCTVSLFTQTSSR